MTPEDIIEMARQTHVVPYIIGPNNTEYLKRLEAFAKLVAAKERDDLCKYFQELEDKATSVRDKMYLSGVQFVIRARENT